MDTDKQTKSAETETDRQTDRKTDRGTDKRCKEAER